MTVRKFLAWYLGAVLFVGTAGAGGYQVLLRQRAQPAMQQAAEPATSEGPPAAMAAAQPVVPDVGQAAALPPQPSSHPANAPGPLSHRSTVALRPFPALRPHLAAADHASRQGEQRPARRALAARPTHHWVAVAAATRTRTPHPLPGRYVVRLRQAGGYAVPPPSFTYYAYPGYQPYPPGYAYYYAPRYYPYYRVY